VTRDLTTQSPESAATLHRILESARACFLKYGVRGTRMSDIANGAGMVRQTLYDWVSSRDELVDLAMAQRSREMGEIIRRRRVDRRLPIGEQIVNVLAAMIDLASSDPEFELLAQAMPERHAFAFMAGPSALTDVVESLLEPYFDRARDEGILREDMGSRALAEWIQTVLAPLRTREDLDPGALRRQLRFFLLPALVRE
jgi:AcrR family transcriptional regulator